MVAATVGACTTDRDDRGPGIYDSIGGVSQGGADTGTTGSVNGSGDDDDDGGDDDTEKLDLADPGIPTDSCYAADLLFVIDNSGSMCDAQVGLAGVIPDLVDAMFDSLPSGTDLHVGIVTTSFSHGGSHAESGCAAVEGPAIIEDAYVTDQLINHNGYQGRLFEYDDQRYFSARTHDDAAREELADWFSGAIVQVGCDGGAFEFPAAAAAYAVDSANAENNAGFLRDAGAALAIFVLTNETDQSPEGLSTYATMINNAKSDCGGDECILTAGLLAPNCVPDYNPFIWQFLNAFGAAPAWGDISDFDNYRAVVAETLALGLAETCDEIGPVG